MIQRCHRCHRRVFIVANSVATAATVTVTATITTTTTTATTAATISTATTATTAIATAGFAATARLRFKPGADGLHGVEVSVCAHRNAPVDRRQQTTEVGARPALHSEIPAAQGGASGRQTRPCGTGQSTFEKG